MSGRIGWVYFVSAFESDISFGLLKVGYAKDPEHRHRDLQTALPVKLHTEAAYRGTRYDEARVHRLLRPHRVRGEWFRYNDDVENVICDIGDAWSLIRAAEGGAYDAPLADCLDIVEKECRARRFAAKSPIHQVNIGE